MSNESIIELGQEAQEQNLSYGQLQSKKYQQVIKQSIRQSYSSFSQPPMQPNCAFCSKPISDFWIKRTGQDKYCSAACQKKHNLQIAKARYNKSTK